MTTSTDPQTVSPDAQAFLGRVRSALWFLPGGDRAETVEGIRTHLHEATENGADVREVVRQLGSPQDIAAQAADDFEARTRRTAVPRYLNPARGAQIAAFAFALAAALFALLVPMGISESVGSDGQRVVEATSLLTTGSAFTITAILAPVLIALIPLLVRGRAWRGVTVAAAVLLLIFVVVGGFSVGLFFVPAFAAEVIAAVLTSRSRVRSA